MNSKNSETKSKVAWSEKLASYRSSDVELYDEVFLTRWGDQDWDPGEADQKAASLLHTQIVSRVTTQRIGYQDGDEVAALESVASLFEKAREAADANFGARHFDVLVWHVLNTHVRPFTSRWHRESKGGALSALDATDEFRGELKKLQAFLVRFDELLLEIRDGLPPPVLAAGETSQPISREMRTPLPHGINVAFGGIHSEYVTSINEAERIAITARRENYSLPVEPLNSSGLAISGGGIRSATFALGILSSLGRRNLLPQFDYLSTVSGGGYLGTFITTFLNSKLKTGPTEGIGLSSKQQPFVNTSGESTALRYIRHRSKYLQTSIWERIKLAGAQLYGMATNSLALAAIPITIALFESLIRSPAERISPVSPATIYAVLCVGVACLVLPVISRFIPFIKRFSDSLIGVVLTFIALMLIWYIFGYAHTLVETVGQNFGPWLLILSSTIPILGSAASIFLGNRYLKLKSAVTLYAAFVFPIFFICIELLAYWWISEGLKNNTSSQNPRIYLAAIIAVALWCFALLLDINFTAPYRHYKRKLSDTFLLQLFNSTDSAVCIKAGISTKLSNLIESERSPYPIINCALNVPGSTNPAMQGRLTDFFMFSPAFSGSPLIGYRPTTDWETADADLDTGAAMAMSGAALSPVMGFNTASPLRFWLTILNVRLGYWISKPGTWRFFRPNIIQLIHELLGSMSERGKYYNLTDGGHIENLGVYELLRRRCQFIVAIDGEQDSEMTFHGLANLQRLAAIDFGTRIDINLDDLRLRDQGMSRSHFRFCRIIYPGIDNAFGYLLYIKLSLTGNEGEFLRRHRLDEPVFPHHPTSHQNFSEVQFEAYRALGEHIGDKLFLQALVGDLSQHNDIKLTEWFEALGLNLLRAR